MTTPRVALLRAVNLGPHNNVSMTALLELAGALGFTDARTVLQSGSLLFHDPKRSASTQIERLLERELASRFGIRTDVFVRDAIEWASIVAANPFPSEARKAPSHLVVAVGRDPIPVARVEALQRATAGLEQLRAAGRELYIYYPDGIGRSRLTAALMARHLGSSAGTARNWNTVRRIDALLRQLTR
jgi:uncharacterized protein (DUF1697 family)